MSNNLSLESRHLLLFLDEIIVKIVPNSGGLLSGGVLQNECKLDEIVIRNQLTQLSLHILHDFTTFVPNCADRLGQPIKHCDRIMCVIIKKIQEEVALALHY